MPGAAGARSSRQVQGRRSGGASVRSAQAPKKPSQKKAARRKLTIRQKVAREAARIPVDALSMETQAVLGRQTCLCPEDRYIADSLKVIDKYVREREAHVSKSKLVRVLARFFHPGQREAAIDDFVRILPRLRPDEVKTFLRVVTARNEADLRMAIRSISPKPRQVLENQAVQVLGLEKPNTPAPLSSLALNGGLLFLIFGLLFLVDGGVGLMAAGLVSLAAAVIAVVDTTYRVNADSYGLLALVLAVGNGAFLAAAGEPLFTSPMTTPVVTTVIGGVAALGALLLPSLFTNKHSCRLVLPNRNN